MHSDGDLRQKLVIVGSAVTGKTTLLLSALHGRYHPSENQKFFVCPGLLRCTCDDKDGKTFDVEMSLWDKAGTYDSPRFETLQYPGSTVAVIVYAIDSVDSLECVEERWFSEVRHFLKDAPIVLVGLKKDLRDGEASNDSGKQGNSFVSREMGEMSAKRIGAAHFTECSSLTGDGVTELFDSAAALAYAYSTQKAKKKRCCFL